jgi:glycosyltransferase involved in cell wall biosynthesis
METEPARGRGALILAHNRQELLDQTVAAIRPQTDTIMVIDNASEPKLTVPEGVGSMFIPEQPPVLSRFWNIGLDWFVQWYDSQGCGLNYDVAVLCDDAPAPEGWFTAVTEAMRETGAAIGCSNPWGHGHAPVLKTQPDRDIMGRMPGWAWITKGSLGLRADERLHWWFQDTKIDWDARRMGGMVMIGDHPVPNQRPNEFTAARPDMAEQAGRDGEMFAVIEGWRPW